VRLKGFRKVPTNQTLSNNIMNLLSTTEVVSSEDNFKNERSEKS
jgi:hypothetical protein